MDFGLYVGIDYSGAETSESRLKALQVFATTEGPPQRVIAVPEDGREHWNWSRAGIAEFLIELAGTDTPYIAGIGHGFSFPLSYFERYDLTSWDEFLHDFQRHWPGPDPHTRVEFIHDEGSARSGWGKEFRLCERWTSSPWSALVLDCRGRMARFRHAGIPWLCHIRREVGDRVHFWPFDGWEIPEGRSAIAEVYPQVFRNRYRREERSPDQQDAYAVARWLKETVDNGFLGRYLNPPLTAEEQELARREGWILGIA